MRDYGKALRSLRRNKNYTQQELAKMLNVVPQTVSKWENGINQIDMESLTSICAIFEITTDEFIRLAEDDSPRDGGSPDPVAEECATEERAKETKTSAGTAKETKSSAGGGRKSGSNRAMIAAMIAVFVVLASLLVGFVAVSCGGSAMSAEDIYKKVNPSVFYIEVDVPNGKQGGSGFFIDGKGTAVTNFHVLKGGTSASVTLADGKKYSVKQVVGCDVDGDIAIISVDVPRSVPVSLGNSSGIKTGESVYAIGYPESFILGAQESTFTSGIVSKPAYNVEGRNYIQTTADITHGNSGGVLVDKYGKVVGITTGKIDLVGVSYMNLCIPSNNIKSVKRNLKLSMTDFSSAYREVTVKFMNGSSVFATKSCSVGGRVFPPDNTDLPNCEFVGWFSDAKFLSPFDFEKPISSDTVVYGKWKENSHFTVTYYVNGEVYDTEKIFKGGKASPETRVVYLNDRFVGWFSDSAMTVPFTSETVIDRDMRVYAKLIAWEYTIKYVEKEGTAEGQILSTSSRTDFPLLSPFKKNVGYRFIGWENGGKIYDVNARVDALNLVLGDKEIVFTAQYEALSYNVVYKIFEDDQTFFEKSEKHKSGEYFELFVPQFVPDGYYFKYWSSGYNSLSGSVNNEELGAYSTEDNEATVTLRAVLGGITFYIDLYNADSEVFERVEMYYGRDNLTLRNDYQLKKGYTYVWQVFDKDGNLFTGDLNKATTAAGEVLKAKPVFTPKKYTVIFLTADDRTVEYELEYDKEMIVPEEVCSAKKGYRFTGFLFYSEEVGNSVYVFAGDKLLNLTSWQTDVILRGQSEANSYKIVYDANGGTGETASTDAKCGEKVALAANGFEKVGYCFVGWKNGDETFGEGDKVEFYVDEGETVGFVAQWEEILSGSGTESDPFKVSSAGDLKTFAKMVGGGAKYQSAHYVLTSDIDCKNADIGPIGDDLHPFRGVFDGQSHVIRNAVFVVKGDYQGLFGKADSSAELKNFGIKNYKMSGDGAFTSAPVACDYSSSQPIENVFASGVIDITVKPPRLMNWTVTVGGFVAKLDGKAVNCYSESSVSVSVISTSSSDSAYVGGFVGNLTGEVEHCYFNGNVSCTNATRDISMRTGGFGANAGTTDKTAVIRSSFFLGKITVTGGLFRYYGKFIGISTNATLSDIYYDKAVELTVSTGSTRYTFECTEGRDEESTRLKSVQWLINELGFDGNFWTEEFGLPVLKSFALT